MNIKKFVISFFAFLVILPCTDAQRITKVEAKWLDSFREWNIETEVDGLDGSLSATWALSDDWAEWGYDLGENTGSMKLKFAPDPNLWEFRSGNEVITARTIWSNDITEWRFTDGERIIQLRLKRDATPFIWFSEGETHGFIDIYTEYEQDPRVWLIEDKLNEDISVLYRMAMIFIAINHSSPKF